MFYITVNGIFLIFTDIFHRFMMFYRQNTGESSFMDIIISVQQCFNQTTVITSL